MASYCACGRYNGICECKDNCSCCPSMCDCVPCYKIRKTQLICSNCGHGAACHKNKTIEDPTMYPGVRINKLPDLDFLNPRPASGATGHSPERKDPRKIPISNNSRRQASDSSSSEDPLIFQMDDIDTCQPPVLFNVEVAPGSSFELPEATYTEAAKYSPAKSSQRNDYSPSRLSTKSALSLKSVSPKKYPNRSSKSGQPIFEDSGCVGRNSDLQLPTDEVISETEAQPPCSESKEMQKVSDLEQLPEKIQPDRQESSKSDLPK